MIRTLLVLVAIIIYLILSVPLMLIEALFRLKFPEQTELFHLRVVQGLFKLILFLCGTKITLLGYENIPEDEAVLFIGNHQSYFDIVISYSQMKNRTGFVSKDGLKKIPIMNWNMLCLHCLFLNRQDLKQGLETIKTAIEYVKEGVSMFIYPEGTRNKAENELDLMDFHRGSFKIAQRSGCKIIPISFNNTSQILERHFPAIRSTHVVIEYGEPILYKDLSREDQKQIDVYFRNIIIEMMKKNQALV